VIVMKKASLKAKISIFISFVVFIAISTIYYKYYGNTVSIIQSEYRTRIDLIEQSIINETKYTEILSIIAERDLEEDMKKTSHELVELYKENPHILKWNMVDLKHSYGDFDIYIIDEDMKIVSSSIEEEIGMSFADLPSFSRTLKRRMSGNEFESDSINFSMLESELKKYSYMPTPDNKYLIELSVTIKDRYPELENLNILYLSKRLINKYPFIENIQVYKYDIDTKKSEMLFYDEDTLIGNRTFEKNEELIRNSFETLEIQEHIVTVNGGNYTVRYIPHNLMASEMRMNWWGTYVIEIVYNDFDLTKSINKQRTVFYQSIILTSIIYIALSYMIIYTILKNRKMAYTDYLTQIPNRKKFEEYMENAILEADKKKTKIAVFFLDLDGFKDVNDIYGHNTGDKILQEVALRLKSSMPKNGVICRLGGDEFVGAITGFTEINHIDDNINQISNVFKTNFEIEENKISINSSIGISIYPGCSNSVEQLVHLADEAMYFAKHNQLKYSICQKGKA